MKTKSLSVKEKDGILDAIFYVMVNDTASLTEACKRAKNDFKLETLSHSTVLSWIEKSERADEYARIRELRAHLIFEEILAIADNSTPGEDNAAIHRDKLRIDTRKWMLGKMLPKKYGDKVEITESMPRNVPVKIVFTGRDGEEEERDDLFNFKN